MCYLNDVFNSGVYFKNVNDCLYYSKRLSNQTYMKDNEQYTYECICKLVPYVNKDKVRVY